VRARGLWLWETAFSPVTRDLILNHARPLGHCLRADASFVSPYNPTTSRITHPRHLHVHTQLSRTPRADTGTRGCRVEVRQTAPVSSSKSVADGLSKRRYDMRHQCQEILPGLLLGPFQVSKNLTSLKELSISHMYASLLS
jgi:hypothetical protein